ncbi:MAG TPA: hypothetical protein VG452_07160, partial [Egibacteraceae bacterium]|nr:hypothetical protein [Egibacteraceae bacterium]
PPPPPGGVRAAAASGRALSRACAAAGELRIDGVVERLAGWVGFAGRDSRRLQTGLAHQYYVIVAVGLAVAVVVALWRS